MEEMKYSRFAPVSIEWYFNIKGLNHETNLLAREKGILPALYVRVERSNVQIQSKGGEGSSV